jgi:hypothetical protein
MGGPEKRAHQQTKAGDDRSSDDDVSLAALVRDRAKRRRVLPDDSNETSPGAGLPPQQRTSLEMAGRKTRVPSSNGAAHASTADAAHERAAQQLHERETDAWSSLEAESGDQPQSKVQQWQVSTPLHLLLCTFGLRICRCTASRCSEAGACRTFAWPMLAAVCHKLLQAFSHPAGTR